MNHSGGYDDSPLLSEFYDFTPPYTERGDVEFYVEYSRSANGKILELGCGTGRILIPTVEAGCEIVGLDISKYMLARCRSKLEGKPKDVQGRVKLVHANMVDFDLKETFALITAPFRSFQHLMSVRDQLACLWSVNRHLAIGGRLVLDIFQVDLKKITDPGRGTESEDFPGTQLPDGRSFRRTHRIIGVHQTEQYQDVEMIFYVTYPDGHVERLLQKFPFRHFFKYEVEHLLTGCGFEVVDLFGDFDKSALTDGSPQMIFVAEKRENTIEG